MKNKKDREAEAKYTWRVRVWAEEFVIANRGQWDRWNMTEQELSEMVMGMIKAGEITL